MAQSGYTPIQLYYSTTSGNTPSASNLALGELALNIPDAKLFYKTSGGAVQVLAANDVEFKVYNNTGSTIAQGAAVYLSGGASGQTPYISLAIATSQAAANVIGLTTAAITTGSTGYVTTVGLSSSLNTSSFTAGDTLYLSASSAGALTSTAPSSPNYAVRVGFVAYANATGYVFVNKTNQYTNATSVIGTLTTAQGGTGLTTYTAGDISYYASGTALSKLGIGTAGYFLTSSGTAPQWTQTLGIANGGTGQTTANAAFNALAPSQTSSSGYFLTTNGSNTSWASIAGFGVSSISFGSTGLTPATATTGAVTVAGTLATGNGGTGLTTFTSGGAVYASSTSALTTGTLPTASGGTNLTSFTSGGAVYASSTSVLTTGTLPTASGGTNLTSFTSGGAVYASSTSALTTGTLPIASGGTSQTTAAAAFNALSPITSTGDLILGNGTNSATRLAIGTNAYVLTSNGTTASWAAPASSGVSSISFGSTGLTPSTATAGGVTVAGTLAVGNGGTGLTAGTSGGIPYYSSTSALTSSALLTQYGVLYGGGAGAAPVATAAGTTGQVLTATTGGAPTWAAAAGATITGTTTSATYYIIGTTSTSGSLTTASISNTNAVSYDANTGALTAVSHVSSSDERLKENWSALPSTFLENLANVKHGTYRRIGKDWREVGVSAQSLKEVLPEAVLEDDFEMLSVSYGNAALVAAIELAKEVKLLRAEIEILKSK